MEENIVTPIVEPKKKPILEIVLAVLLIISLITAGDLFFRNQKLQKEITKLSAQPTPLPTPAQTPDPTANWKTFASKNNRQIKYPTDWKIKESQEQFSVEKDEYQIVFSFPTSYGPGTCIFSDSPNFNKNDPNDPIMMGSKCPEKYVETNGVQSTFRRKITPDTSPKGIQNGSWSIFTKDLNGNFVTVPPISYKTPINYDESLLTKMDQILSTFKFTP